MMLSVVIPFLGRETIGRQARTLLATDKSNDLHDERSDYHGKYGQIEVFHLSSWPSSS